MNLVWVTLWINNSNTSSAWAGPHPRYAGRCLQMSSGRVVLKVMVAVMKAGTPNDFITRFTEATISRCASQVQLDSLLQLTYSSVIRINMIAKNNNNLALPYHYCTHPLSTCESNVIFSLKYREINHYIGVSHQFHTIKLFLSPPPASLRRAQGLRPAPIPTARPCTPHPILPLCPSCLLRSLGVPSFAYPAPSPPAPSRLCALRASFVFFVLIFFPLT